MASIEELLSDARREAHALLQELVEREDGDAMRRLTGTGSRPPMRERGRYEDSLREGTKLVMSSTGYAMRATGADHLEPHMGAIAHGFGGGRYAADPHPRLQRIGECLAAVGDIGGDRLSKSEQKQVRDQIATTAAHVARAVAGAHTRNSELERATIARLSRVAQELDASRTTTPLTPLGRAGQEGVPEPDPLQQSLTRWSTTARAATQAHRIAESPPTAADVAQTASLVSAAAYRVCKAQAGPAMQDLAQRWRAQAIQWQQAASSWEPPPMIVGGRTTPDPEVIAEARSVHEAIKSEFQDANGKWLPPEQLVDHERLQGFERNARRAIADLAESYHAGVGSVARSEVLAVPVKHLNRSSPGQGVDPEKRLAGSRAWTTLPAKDPAAVRLGAEASQVEVASLNLNRPGPTSPAHPGRTGPTPSRGSGAAPEVGPRHDPTQGFQRD